MKKTVRAVTIMILVSVLLTCPVSHALRGVDEPCFGDGLRASPGHSTTAFISWSLTHVDPSTIPECASLPIPVSYCGTEPWQYLYGTIRLRTDENALRSFYINHYGEQMTEPQYRDLTDGWDRNGYATDCQGLLDAWLTYEQHEPTDINVQMNYANWCTQKGPIDEIDRPYRIGEALFVQAESTGKMTHIGWICGFDEDGTPLTVDARGISYGVIVSRMDERGWTHRGLMTAVFTYPQLEPSPEELEPILPLEAYFDDDARSSRRTLDPGPLWFGGGTGTEDDPLRISAPEHLLYLAERVNSGTPYNGYYFRITNDITLNDTSDWTEWGRDCAPASSWTPIGYWDAWNDHAAFGGVIDGGGHTIRGLYFFEDQVSFAGLFGYVSGGTLKNIRIDESYIHALNNVGGIAGYIDNGTTVENCSYRGKLNAELWVGGVVGYAASSSGTQTIENCASAAIVEGFYEVGGVAGGMTDGNVLRRSFNSGIVDADDRVGGIVGNCRAALIEDCYNSGRTRGTATVGGIAGRSDGLSASRCYNAGRLVYKRAGGSVAGLALPGSVFENCLYLSENGPTGDVGEPKTRAELQLPINYTGFDFLQVWMIDPRSGYPYAQLTSNPHIAAPDPLWGDADLDGEVTVADAVLVLRCAMGLTELDEDSDEIADIDHDGEVTVADALAILRVSMTVR